MEKSVTLEELLERITELQNQRNLLTQQRAVYGDLLDEAKMAADKLAEHNINNFSQNKKQAFGLDLQIYATTQKMLEWILFIEEKFPEELNYRIVNLEEVKKDFTLYSRNIEDRAKVFAKISAVADITNIKYPGYLKKTYK